MSFQEKMQPLSLETNLMKREKSKWKMSELMREICQEDVINIFMVNFGVDFLEFITVFISVKSFHLLVILIIASNKNIWPKRCKNNSLTQLNTEYY